MGVNYDTHTLSLNQTTNWNSNTPVNYDYIGCGPDIGALESSVVKADCTPNPPLSDPFDIQPTGGDSNPDYLDLQAWITRIGYKAATLFDFSQIESLLIGQ